MNATTTNSIQYDIQRCDFLLIFITTRSSSMTVLLFIEFGTKYGVQYTFHEFLMGAKTCGYLAQR